MKLRLLDDSLRIRIQRSELDALNRHGRLEGATHFGPAPDAAWRYALIRDADAAPLSVAYAGGLLTVGVSATVLADLAGSERVGVEVRLPLGASRILKVILEKDYACLSPREDDADAFPHPATNPC